MKSRDRRTQSRSKRLPEPSRRPPIAPIVAVLAIAGIIAWSIRDESSKRRPLHLATPPGAIPVALAPQPRLPDPITRPLVEPQPWAATPTNTPAPPSGQIPAWEVRPPAPDPNAIRPVDPPPPPDPITVRPPMDNPGGVNGARPPR